MRNEYDFGKALKYIAFDLETTTGHHNLGRQFTETLDKAAESAADWFRHYRVKYHLRNRVYTHDEIKDEYLEHDSVLRLKKHMRQLIKEHYIEVLVQLLTVGADEIRSPEEVGVAIAYDFMQDLIDKCKTK